MSQSSARTSNRAAVQPAVGGGLLTTAVRVATAAVERAFGALRGWLRGATGSQAYEAYLRHAREHAGQPLTAGEFYAENARRKYSRPSRCC
jgi:uncharacterized short protein YbdD (DUF466 family)